jgi:UDP-2,4-diacetamido-2,4,6-trideoxy-beta-L-altropyranose hydrolase
MSDCLLIRADASTQIGTGHVMRCLALAQAWQRSGGSAIFASADMTAALEARLAGEGFQSVRLSVAPGTKEDAARTGELARSQNASWIVADGYNFGLDYQRGIKAAGLCLLFLDDYGHAGEYLADLVLNQNITADAALYARRAPYTRLLLGTRYALLREEFLRWRDWQREIPRVAHKVLVTLGGSDPDNMSGKVIQALKQFSEIETKVVVGGSNPHQKNLKTEIRNSKSKISLVMDATNMPELMAWADVAIAAGGTTSWELAFMGLPSLVLMLAENQRGIAAALGTANAAHQTTPESLVTDLKDLLRDHELRRVLSQRGRQLVDGFGVSRVATCISAAGLELRRARAEDCRLVWEWANELETRAVSLTPAPIPWEVHQKWFAQHMNSPACLFYLAANSHQALVGQIRFDIKDANAVVSVSLAKEVRGRGYGAALIRRGAEQCFADSVVNLIRAFIMQNNENSVRAFLKAGFTDDGIAEMAGRVMRQFVMLRERIS